MAVKLVIFQVSPPDLPEAPRPITIAKRDSERGLRGPFERRRSSQGVKESLALTGPERIRGRGPAQNAPVRRELNPLRPLRPGREAYSRAPKPSQCSPYLRNARPTSAGACTRTRQ